MANERTTQADFGTNYEIQDGEIASHDNVNRSITKLKLELDHLWDTFMDPSQPLDKPSIISGGDYIGA